MHILHAHAHVPEYGSVRVQMHVNLNGYAYFIYLFILNEYVPVRVNIHVNLDM
jgi:hypothetical protein